MRLVSGYFSDFYPFHKLPCIDDLAVATHPQELQEGDVLVIWGGADISPSLYRKPLSSRGSGSVPPSHRDYIEWTLMQQAKTMGLPILGICRGAQMLCALAGGHLLQDVNKHGGTHIVTTFDGHEFSTNSIHHQMMYPWDVKHEMLASIKPGLSTEKYEVEDLITIPEEPEFVYFPEVKGYAVQWHPEYMPHDSAATKFVFNEFLKRETNVV
jgi:putative glutamine amidotransferase